MHTEVQEDACDVIHPTFFQYLKMAYIYDTYNHLAYILYKHKVRQMTMKPQEADKGKANGTSHR